MNFQYPQRSPAQRARFSQVIRRSPASLSWTLAVLAIAALVMTPVVVVLSSIFTDSSDIWNHLASTVLPRYIGNSLVLMLGVGCGVSAMGIATAWLVTVCRFPGRRVFEWALLLPLASPAYLLAYTYTELLGYFGPVQLALRSLFRWDSIQDYWFPNIRSIWGAILMLSLSLYPYVYLLARVAFQEQSIRSLEASRVLGCNPWRSFFSVALPLARPAIMGGLALALMETLNDFGTVEYFGVNTFTTGIYRTWFGMGERVAATQLAAVLMLFILALILWEGWSRRQAKYYQCDSPQQVLPGYPLWGMRQIGAQLICCLPIALGLLVPMAYLIQLAVQNASETFDDAFWQLSRHSLLLAIATALTAVPLSLVVAYGLRLNPKPPLVLGARLASMGYAVPGAVIAVGLLIPLGQFDQVAGNFGLVLGGTAIALVLAYLVRFLAVSLNTVESSLQKIKPNLDDASRSLGHGPGQTLLKIHLPLMNSGLLTAVMLVFVDVMKELPATLVMRPFNFDTLAIRVYQYASDERLAAASAPALAILAVGLLPVVLLSWRIAQGRSRA
ncbi:MAG: iron ABC transporter permease [Synechococcales cyanobacterium CRU_2_2]|nr:iron ABC transporter permease [Synechococcales cyanobacterium CRU_2_2]